MFSAARFSKLVLLTASLFSQSIFATETSFSVDVLGHSYQIVVVENTSFNEKVIVVDPLANGTHYTGYAEGVDGSWVRMSKIDDQWQGVISIYGEMYTIQNGVTDVSGALSSQMQATAMSQHGAQMGTCGADGHEHSVLENVSQMSSQQAQSNASLPTLAATFSEYCSQQVNGICLIAEIEVAFDLEFQALFPGQETAQALSILNIVDGHYENDLSIAIDAITVSMLNNNLFDVTTNAGLLLDDIELKKNNGQIPFITNNNAITHLVTGRDLDGNTLGIAFLGSVCSANGANSGLSSVAINNGTPDPILTAIVVAHELGHNLGSIHDGPGENTACPASQFIMSPILGGSGITSFSACSAADIETTLSGLPNPALCLDFPVDITVTEDAGNNGSLDVNDEFVLSYTVTLNEGFLPISQMSIDGDVDLLEGRFIDVTANNVACSIAANGDNYSCSLNGLTVATSMIDLQVRVRLAANAASLMISQDAQNLTADIQDIDPSNNTLMSQFLIAAGELSSTTATNNLTPSPTPDNGDSNASSSDDSGGGGGGAIEWYLLFGLFALYLQTRRKTV